jgi:hypothetical protein
MSIDPQTTQSTTSPIQRTVGTYLFLTGLILAILFSIIVFWPDQEATLFDQSLSSQGTLTTMRCPLIITPRDDASVRITLTNTHDRDTSLRVRSRISAGSTLFLREETLQIDLVPDESATLAWPIEMDDAAYGRVVLSRVYQYRRSPFPARSQTCGVLAVDVPQMTGGQIIGVLVTTSTASLTAGIWLWRRGTGPLVGRNREAARIGGTMLLLVLLSIVLGLLQRPFFALVLLLGSSLFVVSLLERLGSGGGRRAN